MQTQTTGKKKRIAFVYSKRSSDWTSCQVIVPNLLKTYQHLYRQADCELFDLNETQHYGEVAFLAERIFNFNPDKLIFVDHSPHPRRLIFALEGVYKRGGLPEFAIHVFGDFTLYLENWEKLEPILKKVRVRWICASERQVKLVSGYLNDPDSEVSLCPFPVDSEVYQFNESVGIDWRKELGISKKDFVVVYTGRLSLQKNITRLLKTFLQFSLNSKKKTFLLIAGAFDDIGAPFFGIRTPEGYYFQKLNELLLMFPSSVRENIHFLGSLESTPLRDLYLAGDTYVSFSLHHDEDYGMAPAEALCCGLPTVLTDWGGYASFNLEREEVLLLETCISKKGLDFDTKKALHFLNNLGSNPVGSKKRSDLSQLAIGRFSILAAAKILREIHEKPFTHFRGFNWKLNYHKRLLWEKNPFEEQNLTSNFYPEIYGNYATRVDP